VDDSGKQVSTIFVRSQQKKGPFFHTKEMEVRLEQVQETVFLSVNKEMDGMFLGFVYDAISRESLHVYFVLYAIYEGPQMDSAIAINNARDLRRGIFSAPVALFHVVRRKETGKGYRQVREQKNNAAD
jgi:hypothetical protein